MKPVTFWHETAARALFEMMDLPQSWMELDPEMKRKYRDAVVDLATPLAEQVLFGRQKQGAQ